jgi:deazaflavin-dependent oxidoreductase (nitroreductase family)
MPIPTIKRRWWHTLIQRGAATSFGIWLLSKTLHRIDKPLLKLTGNRASFTSWLAGLPVVMLTTKGAKTGLMRHLPLVVLEDGEKLILIASFFGSHRHPAWYYNLKAHPQAQVSYPNHTAVYLSRQAEGKERQRYWEMAKELYLGYSLYKRQASDREIPIMVLEPISTHPKQSPS